MSKDFSDLRHKYNVVSATNSTNRASPQKDLTARSAPPAAGPPTFVPKDESETPTPPRAAHMSPLQIED